MFDDGLNFLSNGKSRGIINCFFYLAKHVVGAEADAAKLSAQG
jgi:hypothetical protein